MGGWINQLWFCYWVSNVISLLTVTNDSCAFYECEPTVTPVRRYFPVWEDSQVCWLLVIFEMGILRTIYFQACVCYGCVDL